MGVLRIHFSSEDLARIRISAVADPMWEITLGQFRMRQPVAPPYRQWSCRVRAGATLPRRAVEVVRAVLPWGNYFPDFLAAEFGAYRGGRRPAHGGEAAGPGSRLL